MLAEEANLNALFAVAAGVGVLHTLAGPDHYLPLVAIGQSRSWTLRRLVGATVGLGLIHCAVSALLVVGLMSLWGSVASDTLVDAMATTSAWLMVGTGVALMVAAWRRRRIGPPRDGRAGLVLLSLVFLVGPCEWLIPCALSAGAEHGLWGALGVCAVYTLCTVSTMVTAVTVIQAGLHRVVRQTKTGPAFGGLLAALTCAACGTLMLLGY